MSKQCLDVHQMQHLQELGLELKETILVWARFMLGKTSISDWEIAYNHSAITDNSQTIPAYTLQDVLDALPTTVLYDKRIYELNINMCNESMEYVRTSVDDVLVGLRFTQLSLIDAAYSMLCWAIENKFVETNKNK